MQAVQDKMAPVTAPSEGGQGFSVIFLAQGDTMGWIVLTNASVRMAQLVTEKQVCVLGCTYPPMLSLISLFFIISLTHWFPHSPFSLPARLLLHSSTLSVTQSSTLNHAFIFSQSICSLYHFHSLFLGFCTCMSGWTGRFCEKFCPEGSWGSNCSIPCSCENGARCNPANGECICLPTSGCQCAPGWTGSDCRVPCNDTVWGPNCRNACLCSLGKGVCNQVQLLYLSLRERLTLVF